MTIIIGPQEVDKFDDLADLFREDGYTGIYKVCIGPEDFCNLHMFLWTFYMLVFQQRTGEATDGCAIFWKENE